MAGLKIRASAVVWDDCRQWLFIRRFRTKLSSVKVGYGFCALVLLWLLAGDPLINTVMVLGGGYLLWHLRAQLTPVTVIWLLRLGI